MAQSVADAVERELEQVRSNDEAEFKDWLLALSRSVPAMSVERTKRLSCSLFIGPGRTRTSARRIMSPLL
jgi:hypothetical protein